MNESDLFYPGTTLKPEVGDQVRYLHEPELLIVEDVINSPEKKKQWGVDESGIMLKGKPFGLVFDQIDPEAEIEFVTRKKE